MYVMLVKLQSIQNEDNNKKLGRFGRSVQPFRNVTP